MEGDPAMYDSSRSRQIKKRHRFTRCGEGQGRWLARGRLCRAPRTAAARARCRRQSPVRDNRSKLALERNHQRWRLTRLGHSLSPAKPSKPSRPGSASSIEASATAKGRGVLVDVQHLSSPVSIAYSTYCNCHSSVVQHGWKCSGLNWSINYIKSSIMFLHICGHVARSITYVSSQTVMADVVNSFDKQVLHSTRTKVNHCRPIDWLSLTKGCTDSFDRICSWSLISRWLYVR
jgi:hypothetical protein